MKVLLRVITILGAALIVVGITFALEQSGVIQLSAPTRPDSAEFTRPTSLTDDASVDATDARIAMRPPEGDLGSMAWRGASDLLKSVAIVSVIVVVFAGGKFVWARVRGKHRGSPPDGQAASATSA